MVERRIEHNIRMAAAAGLTAALLMLGGPAGVKKLLSRDMAEDQGFKLFPGPAAMQGEPTQLQPG